MIHLILYHGISLIISTLICSIFCVRHYDAVERMTIKGAFSARRAYVKHIIIGFSSKRGQA